MTSASLTGASSCPDITWQYYGLVSFMLSTPGMYTLDNKRAKLHEELCEHYGLSKKESQKVTSHMGGYPDAVAVHWALDKLKKVKKEPS